MSSVLPNAVTELGGRVDMVQLWLIAVMGFWFIACNGVMIYLLLRYRRKSSEDETPDIKGSHILETVWTVVPTIICGFIFYYGVQAWAELRTMPEDGYEVTVKARKWAWTFTHPDGRVEAQSFYVPVAEPVKLLMKSEDVLHSFFIPEFRVKEDVVPSMYTQLWFQAEVPGTYDIFCTEYCGDNHSQMLGKVHVLDKADWQLYLANELFPVLTPVEEGAKQFLANGCAGCHTVDGTDSIGPSFKGLMGRTEEMEDGTTIVVDEAYIEESIRYPGAKIVKGRPSNQMSSFDYLTQDKIDNIIAYIKEQK